MHTGSMEGSLGILKTNTCRFVTVGEMEVLLQTKLKLVLYAWAHYCTAYHLTACKDEEQLLRHMSTQNAQNNGHVKQPIETGLVAVST